MAGRSATGASYAVTPSCAGAAGVALRGLVLFALVAARSAAVETPPDVEYFRRDGCPRCASARAFLTRLEHERSDLRVVVRDVARDPAALARLRALAAERGIEPLGVPAFFVRGELVVGFASDDTTGARLRTLLGVASGVSPPEAVVLPLVGPLGPDRFGLPAFTLVLGLLDGFNPCATWVLLFVLSLLLNLHDRRRMLLIGGTFVLVSGLAYYAFMAAWLNVFLLVGVSSAVQLALGAVAVGVGALNMKDFFAFARGPSLAIPEAAKPRLYAQMRRVLQAENLPGALAAAAVLAVLVNVVELLCTAGLPAVYTHVLTLRQLPAWQYYAYLALYDAAYMLDDVALLGVAVITLRRLKLQERGGRWLKLLSGTVMLLLGLALLASGARPG
jgi:hypothetical protein